MRTDSTRSRCRGRPRCCRRAIAAAVLALPFASPVAGQVRLEAERPAMGTVFRIVACAGDSASGASALDAAFERIDALDGVLSDYDPDSEVSQIARRYAVGEPVPVSADLAHALALADAWWRRTGGAFDAALGALTRPWRRAVRRGDLPSKAMVDRAASVSGWAHVRVENRTVVFDVPGVRLDFGGIGKGLAADAALAVLASRGVRRALVDAGGDVAAADAPPDVPGWAVSLPAESGGGRVFLENAAIASSGDRYRAIDVDGTRHSHILDPRTGTGQTERRTVTVVASDGATADALATAFSVSGAERIAHLVPGSARAVLVTTPAGERTLLGRLPPVVPPDAPPSDCGGGR